MSRALLILTDDIVRMRAARWVAKAPLMTRIEFKGPKRTLPQNDRLWADLTDIATQIQWHGVTLQAEDWKLIFLDGLKRALRIVPNLDGTGFVNLGRSSSDLSKDEMSDLIELIHAWGAQHGVIFHDPSDQGRPGAEKAPADGREELDGTPLQNNDSTPRAREIEGANG